MPKFNIIKLPYEFRKTRKETIQLGQELMSQEPPKNTWADTHKEAAIYIHYNGEGLYYVVESFSPRSSGMLYQIINKKQYGDHGKEIRTINPYKQVLSKTDLNRIKLIKKLNKLKKPTSK